MNKFVRNLFVFILIIVFISAFSSSYLSLGMDNLAYVVALGIDKSDENNLEVTFLFSATTNVSDSGSSQKAPTFINSVQASSLSTAINMMNTYIEKEINLSHCKVIVFSEELAYDGISQEIYTLINDTQIRPSSNIVISKCNAKTYLEDTSPELENLISKYYEIFTTSSKSTGFVPNSTIGNFFNNLICKTCEPAAILGGLTTENSSTEGSSNSEKNFNIKANQATIEGENSSENIGIAVFHKDKLVGELTALETISLLTIRNKIKRFLISIPDPLNPNEYLDIYLTPKKSTSIKTDTSNSSPFVKIEASFSGRIYSMSENSKYLDPSVLNEISNACNKYLEANISSYLYKTSKEFNSDVSGIGKYALKNFFTTSDFENYNWIENYKNAFFDVKIKTSVKSGMLITET